MALEAFIKDLSAVDEAVQAFYKSVDGGYILDVTPVDGYDVQNVSALKNALARQKGEADEAKKALAEFGDLKPAEVMKKLDKMKSLDGLDQDKKVKELISQAREDLENEYKGKLQSVNGEKEKVTDMLKKAAMGDLMTEIAKAGGHTKIAQALVHQFADVEVGDDGYRVKILGDNGKERFNFDDQGNPVPFTPEDLVKDLQKHPEYGIIFPSSSKSGSGGPSKYQGGGEGVRTITKEQARSGEFMKELNEGKVVVEN
jgi:hypothetical protein